MSSHVISGQDKVTDDPLLLPGKNSLQMTKTPNSPNPCKISSDYSKWVSAFFY
jgi:hypothetical protein